MKYVNVMYIVGPTTKSWRPGHLAAAFVLYCTRSRTIETTGKINKTFVFILHVVTI